MNLTIEQLQRISLGKPSARNMKAIVAAQNQYGEKIGLDLPHRLAMWLANLAIESGGFTAFEENLRYSAGRIRQVFGHRVKTDAEAKKLAGNPKGLAMKVYGNRKDLGNRTAEDGWTYRGRGPKQITGRYNYAAFTAWVRKVIDPNAPDFEEEPDLLLKDPWAGLSAIWYWSERDLNRYADQGDIEMVRKVINGGLNGLADTITYYARAALVLLDRPVNSVKAFQADKGLSADGDPGPRTRSALHEALVKEVKKDERPKDVAVAPVVEEKKVAVEPEGVAKEPAKDKSIWSLIGGALMFMLTQMKGLFETLPEPVQYMVTAAILLAIGYAAFNITRVIQSIGEAKKAIKEAGL